MNERGALVLIRRNLEWVLSLGKVPPRVKSKPIRLLYVPPTRPAVYGTWSWETSEGVVTLDLMDPGGDVKWECTDCWCRMARRPHSPHVVDACFHVQQLALTIQSRYQEDPEDLGRGWNLLHPYERR